MSETIQAAGGIVWRETPQGVRVAVLNRSRYDDWCLPKGKVQAGESVAEAALREVAEETGCRVQQESELGAVHYTVEGRPKTVHFWNMTYVEDDATPDPAEVRAVLWMSPRCALEQLQYPEERRILTEAMSKRGITTHTAASPQSDSAWSRFWNRIARGWRVHRERLISDIEVARIDIVRSPECQPSSEASSTWLPLAEEALERADAAARTGRLNTGWKCLGAARRFQIHGFSKDKRRVLAEALRLEADSKLSDWRRRTIDAALGKGKKDNGEDEDVAVDALIAATKYRDEALDNLHFKGEHLRNQLILICAMLFIAIITLILLSLPDWFRTSADDTPVARLIWGVALFGIVGGSLSALQSLARRSTNQRIPKQVSESYVTAFRPVMGAAGALASYVFLLSGLLPLDAAARAPAVVLSVAFVAGFSERLVLRGVRAVAGDEEKPRKSGR